MTVRVDNSRGWLKVPGIREIADRTLEEQMHGLEFALDEAQGASVLDLGCAEGLIGREFARRGASRVLGIELLPSHLDVAKQACADYPQMKFICAHLARWAKRNPDPEQFDIVLALSVIHKLEFPRVGARFAALSAKKLVVIRLPSWAEGDLIRSKQQTPGSVDIKEFMTKMGFERERIVLNPKNEHLQYWRRR